MRTCETFRERINVLVDGELPADEAAQLHAHVESCPACAEEYEALRRTRRTLACWTTPDADVGLTTAFAKRLTAHISRPSLWSRLFGQPLARLAWGASLVCALGIGLFSWHQHQQAPVPITEVKTEHYTALSAAPPLLEQQLTSEPPAVAPVKTPSVERPKPRPSRPPQPPRIAVIVTQPPETDPTVVLDEHLAETASTWTPAVTAAHVGARLDAELGGPAGLEYVDTLRASKEYIDSVSTPEDLVMAALMELH
ncbi:MAG: hypothetical protein BWY76_00169 [bacterium ADurb.Bin429]|nr:MAG: hypothetical protein BWY76_00169 [bacterium ADurb.Bin429]